MNLRHSASANDLIRRAGYSALFLLVVFFGVGWVFSNAVSFSPEPPEMVVIEAIYPDYEHFVEAASQIDIWMVDHAKATFKAMVTAEQITWLLNRGFQIAVDEQTTAQLAATTVGTCYRTVNELYTHLAEINNQYPDLTELIQYGSSYEGRPLWVLRISNESNQTFKPRYLVMSGTHGREMITPETAMQFIEYLLNGYRSNPDIQMIVDWQETYVIVTANPDGHVRNEAYYAWWRKNTHPYTTCTTGTYGVDLNRNHDFHWGAAGASTNPCSEVYLGPASTSEPETIALQSLVRSLFPDQRGPGLTDPAPANATGVLITVHSFANLVLWPWGDTYTPAPNNFELEILGRQMANFNGYTPAQSIELYPTSGTVDDWAYGELGIAAYTFEIGDGYDGFNPSCSRYDALIQPNLRALFYGARATLAPFSMPSGPEMTAIAMTKSHIKTGETVTIQATAAEQPLNGGNPVSEIQVFIDTPPWAGGAALSLDPEDGSYNSPNETGTILLAIANLPEGQHMMMLRARDDQGNWGLFSTIWLWVGNPTFIPLVNK